MARVALAAFSVTYRSSSGYTSRARVPSSGARVDKSADRPDRPPPPPPPVRSGQPKYYTADLFTVATWILGDTRRSRLDTRFHRRVGLVFAFARDPRNVVQLYSRGAGIITNLLYNIRLYCQIKCRYCYCVFRDDDLTSRVDLRFRSVVNDDIVLDGRGGSLNERLAFAVRESHETKTTREIERERD